MKPMSLIFQLIITLILVVALATAQDKSKKLTPTDTLISRKAMIAKIRQDMERVQTEAEQTLLILRGQLSAFEIQTSDSVRVKK
jgi:hypothetical protein